MEQEKLTDKILQQKKYKKWAVAFALFLGFMWLCTVISKSIYVSELPMVQTRSPEKKFIEHIVEAEGIVVEGGEQAVTALDGMRIENIFVQKGDRIEEGTPLFQIDTADLKEIMKEKETAITRLNYQISDLQTNQALQEQKKQLQEQRAREDYASADRKTGTTVGRAEEEKSKAENELQSHLDHPVDRTSEEDRQEAWDNYYNWVDREYELLDEITEQERIVTNLESAEGTKTDDEKKELEEEKTKLNELRDALTIHERNKVSEPDFSGEDNDYESWKNATKSLRNSIEKAEETKEDAYLDRSSSLKQGERGIEDTLLPDEADSTLTIYQLELGSLQSDLSKYQQIIKQDGMIASDTSGIITDVQITVGGRTPDTAAILLTDDTIPCQFKVNLTKEQKKYVNLQDTVDIKLSSTGAAIDAAVDYLSESTASPGSFDLLINLPAEAASPGISGTMKKNVQGESHSMCIPAEALYKEDERYYVFVVKEKEGILGMELYAEKVSVKVKDQNDLFAALEEGALDQDSQIIISATEELKRGDIIRYQE